MKSSDTDLYADELAEMAAERDHQLGGIEDDFDFDIDSLADDQIAKVFVAEKPRTAAEEPGHVPQ